MPEAYICDQCGNLSIGQIFPSRWKSYDGKIYCSEHCLVDRLSGMKRSPKYKHNIFERIDNWITSRGRSEM